LPRGEFWKKKKEAGVPNHHPSPGENVDEKKGVDADVVEGKEGMSRIFCISSGDLER